MERMLEEVVTDYEEDTSHIDSFEGNSSTITATNKNKKQKNDGVRSQSSEANTPSETDNNFDESSITEKKENNNATAQRIITKHMKEHPFGKKGDSIVIPAGYGIMNNTLYQLKVEKVEDKYVTFTNAVVFPVPLITAINYNAISGNEGKEISFFKYGTWQNINKANSELNVTNNLIKSLSDKGIDVTSSNANKTLDFMTKFYMENHAHIPVKRVSEQLGFIGNGFLLPTEFISSDGTEISYTGTKKAVEFITQKGSIEEWKKAFDMVKMYPVALATIVAAFASPLLHKLEMDSFTVEIAGRSSRGKTSILRITRSVFGHPMKTDLSWSSTKTAVLSNAALFNHLPLMIDDTQKHEKPEDVPRLVYTHSNNQDRERSNVDGTVKESKSWRNIMITTGEYKIADMNKAGGSVARIVSLEGRPFEDAQPEPLMEEVSYIIKRNHGSIGREWIKFLVSLSEEEWAKLEERYRKFRKHYTGKVRDNDIATRQAGNYALLVVTADILNKVFNLQIDLQLFETQWERIMENNTQSDRPLEALHEVYEHIVRNTDKIYTRPKDTNLINPIGEIDKKDKTLLNMYPAELETFMRSRGYADTKTILNAWKEQGVLFTEKGRLQKRVTLISPTKGRIMLYQINLKRVAEIMGLGEPIDFGTVEN